MVHDYPRNQVHRSPELKEGEVRTFIHLLRKPIIPFLIPLNSRSQLPAPNRHTDSQTKEGIPETTVILSGAHGSRNIVPGEWLRHNRNTSSVHQTKVRKECSEGKGKKWKKVGRRGIYCLSFTPNDLVIVHTYDIEKAKRVTEPGDFTRSEKRKRSEVHQ